jgi:hypothetical protein
MRESRDFLEPLSGAPKRKKFCTVDIESKDGDSRWKAGFTRPFLIGTYDPLRRLYSEFADESSLRETPWEERAVGPGGCIGKVMAYLLSPAFVGYTIYAHNGGSFDHLFWLRWLRQHDDEYGFEVIPVQSSIQIIKVWKLPEDPEDPIKDRWTFLDSMKLFPAGLEKLCKTFGLPGKVNQDLDVDEEDPSWSTYLKQDCIALADGLTKIHDLVEDKLGGEVGMTAPSTSMKLFRRRFLGRKGSVKRIPRFAHWTDCQGEAKEKCPGCAHEWIRLGYYGGRTELFETYGEHLQYYDINSSYVAAMRELMPVGDRMVTDELDWSMTETHGGFVECTVRIPPECEFPPLPHRAKKTGKLLFPTGRFSGVWSTKELELLKDPSVNGEILSVRKVVWFRLKEVFTGMVDELWNLRSKCLPKCKVKGCEGCNPDYDEGLSALAKLFGNSLYGKWAMKHERTSIVFSKFKDDQHCFLCQKECEEGLCADCQGSKPASENSGDVWYKANRVEAAYIIPHISSWITSLARIRLWRYMRQAVDAGGTIYYSDSVTGDRTTVVRGPRGIEVLTFEDLWKRADESTTSRDKEFAALAGYDALTHEGWSSIERILRHRSKKTTHRISTKDGQTQVTTDHGIMVDGKKTSPMDFVAKRASFTKVDVPASIPFEVLDIFEHLKDWQHSLSVERPKRIESYSFEADDDSVFIRSTWNEQRGIEPLKVRRWYRRGSPELGALLRLVTTYACDGSASVVGMTTDSRFMLSFCKQHLDVVERVKSDLETIAPGINVFGPHWSDTTYVVRSGTATMACLFAALCGMKSLGKRLPSFVFALDSEGFEDVRKGLVEGDGPLDVAGQMSFTSISQRFAASVSLILTQHGVEHSFSFRQEKEAWSIRTRPSGRGRKGRVLNQEIFESREDEWVYDLTVPGPQTFVDGVGQVLLHNTDSVITDVFLPSSNELGGLKNEYPGHDLTGTFVQAKVYMLESDKFDQPKVTMKGFPYRNTDGPHKTCACEVCKAADKPVHAKSDKEFKSCPCPECIIRCKENLLKLQAGEVLEWRQLEKIRTLAAMGFKRGPRMRKVKKSFKGKYDKRIIQPDGVTTKPVVLDEWEEASTFHDQDDVAAE